MKNFCCHDNIVGWDFSCFRCASTLLEQFSHPRITLFLLDTGNNGISREDRVRMAMGSSSLPIGLLNFLFAFFSQDFRDLEGSYLWNGKRYLVYKRYTKGFEPMLIASCFSPSTLDCVFDKLFLLLFGCIKISGESTVPVKLAVFFWRRNQLYQFLWVTSEFTSFGIKLKIKTMPSCHIMPT